MGFRASRIYAPTDVPILGAFSGTSLGNATMDQNAAEPPYVESPQLVLELVRSSIHQIVDGTFHLRMWRPCPCEIVLLWSDLAKACSSTPNAQTPML